MPLRLNSSCVLDGVPVRFSHGSSFQVWEVLYLSRWHSPDDGTERVSDEASPCW